MDSVCFLSSSIIRCFSVESTRGGLAAGDALCAIGDAGDGPGRGAVSTGDGIKDRNGVGVGVDIGVAVVVGLGVTVGVKVGVGRGVNAGVGVGDRVADGDCVGIGVGNSVGVGVADGEGRAIIGSSVGCASTAGGNCSLGLGAGGRVDPGSDQSLALSPLTKVACNLV